MRVLHLTTWKQRCGVADFAGHIVENLAHYGVESEVFPLQTDRLNSMISHELRGLLSEFQSRAGQFDLVHVQHQVGFFAGAGDFSASIGNFAHLLEGLAEVGIPVAVTFHEEPDFWADQTDEPDFVFKSKRPPPSPLRNRIRRFCRRRCREESLLVASWRKVCSHFRGGDSKFRALVHTPRTQFGLIRCGFAPDSVGVMPLACELREPSFYERSRQNAKTALGIPSDAVLLSIFGFIADYKGHVAAVEALRQLPDRFRLAVVGGVHPENRTDHTLDSMLRLWSGQDPDRLIITGYADRETVDVFQTATDICLAPFRPTCLSASASLRWSLVSGKPTIASNTPAAAEINKEKECVVLSTVDAPFELAWRIRRLADDA